MRFVILDIIRTFAIGLVIFSHATQTGIRIGIPHFYYVSIGGVGVSIFLILSGFVLELNYGKKEISYWSFIKRRLIRIYSVYVLAYLVAVIIELIRRPELVEKIPSHLSHFTCGITGFCAFVGMWGESFLTKGWFIGLIVSLYFFYPLIAPLIRKHPYIAMTTILAVSVVTRLLVGQIEPEWWRLGLFTSRMTDWVPLARLFELGLGVYLVHIIPRGWLKIADHNPWIGRVFAFTGAISLEMYVIHQPLLFIIGRLEQMGYARWMGMGAMLMISIVISAFINLVVYTYMMKNIRTLKERVFSLRPI